ncbi:MAG: hypothetical protein RJA36_1461 [Pseudomonadota bacterium]|jgi:hypothetical protein
MAIAKEEDRAALRGQWTLKSRLLTQEVMIAIRLAATKAEQPIGDWCTTVLHEQARIVLGRPIEKPLPPARLEEVVQANFAELARAQQDQLAEQERRLQGRLDQQLRELGRVARRGRWRR